jgi:hypothetical protein
LCHFALPQHVIVGRGEDPPVKRSEFYLTAAISATDRTLSDQMRLQR